MPSTPTRLLIVDDSALMRKYLREIFQSEGGVEIAIAHNGEEALRLIPEFKPHVITLDINMPVMDGLTCLSHIMTLYPCPVVMVSSLTHEGAIATLEALELGAIDYIPKPDGTISLNIMELKDTLVRCVKNAAKARIRKTKGLTERLRNEREHVAIQAQVEFRSSRITRFDRKTSTASQVTRVQEPARPPEDRMVLIGVSTGGPSTLEEILPLLPADYPYPIVIAQHMPGSFTRVLAERMNNMCAVSVTEVTRPTLLEPGKVYVGRGDADIIIAKRAQGLYALSVPMSSEYLWHPSVDKLVYSALEHCPAESLIGVLLTGMGYDGAAAMAEMFQKGGKTIAESEETAIIFGMPAELIERKGAKMVLPSHKIARQLIQWASI